MGVRDNVSWTGPGGCAPLRVGIEPVQLRFLSHRLQMLPPDAGHLLVIEVDRGEIRDEDISRY